MTFFLKKLTLYNRSEFSNKTKFLYNLERNVSLTAPEILAFLRKLKTFVFKRKVKFEFNITSNSNLNKIYSIFIKFFAIPVLFYYESFSFF